MHTPVLLQQTVDALEIMPGKRFIDATTGEGGHLSKMIELGGTVLGMEWDPVQFQKLSELFKENKQVTLKCGNFKEIETVAIETGFNPVDGILFDLGLSMRQIRASGRGFSFKNGDDPLDMRIDPQTIQTAENIVNTYSEKDLADMMIKNSEELSAVLLSRQIVYARGKKRFKTVGDLNRVIEKISTSERLKARIFQALRIEVNEEFDNIRKGLEGAIHLIGERGRIAIISFHSREDRIVKLFGRQHGLNEVYKIRSGKEGNGFERSAILRVFQKYENKI